ncbi:hypothetical protein AB1Y20_015236 [Prymnesium parvum]|uniref:Mutator-like transposase domain-containing protein n=1 Tax=Prymnesium parvum TaxID=97485 RepID=A0AB34K078_PRYPA
MMVPHVEACARVSHSRALADERALALTAGELMDVRRRVPIPIAFDAQWMKPGKAMNAPDGYGVVIGGRTGKCIMSAYRTKVGELKNHSGSSGSMEPSMGAEVVVRLGSEPTEVYVKQLCMDLDSKTPKAVAEAVCAQRVQHPSLQIPQKLHDPNHFIKALRKRLMKVKKLLHTNNVLPPATQKQLGDEVAMAVHQHRGSRVGIDHLRAAIWNVLDHAFNQHGKCRQFFACPCAPDEHGVISRVKSSYKDGMWLNEAGGPQHADNLFKLLKKEFMVITSDDHLNALNHVYNTQVCEAVNSLHASMHPKRRDMSRTPVGRATHMLATARFNDGLLRSTQEVLRRFGLDLGIVGQIVLAKKDKERQRVSAYKKSLNGKRKRKHLKQKRIAKTTTAHAWTSYV